MVNKHSVALAAGISAALVVSSAAFGVANGVFRSHASDGIARFEVIEHAPATTARHAHPKASMTVIPPPIAASPESPTEPSGSGTTPSPTSPPAAVTADPAPSAQATSTTAPSPPGDHEGGGGHEGEHDDD